MGDVLPRPQCVNIDRSIGLHPAMSFAFHIPEPYSNIWIVLCTYASNRRYQLLFTSRSNTLKISGFDDDSKFKDKYIISIIKEKDVTTYRFAIALKM